MEKLAVENGACLGMRNRLPRCLLRAISICLAASLPFAAASCGGGAGGGGTSAPISVFLSAGNPIGVDEGGGDMLTATVNNDTSGKGVTWSGVAVGCSANCGTITVFSPTTAGYTPSTGYINAFTVEITAASVVDPSKSATIDLTVALDPIITTIPLPLATFNQPYSAMLQATQGIVPYTWSQMPDQFDFLPPGVSLSSDGTISGTPTEAGTFVANISVLDAGGGFTPGSITLQVQAAPGVAILNGQYALFAAGSDSETGSSASVAASFTADALGDITGGVLNPQNGVFTMPVNITGGRYVVGSDGRGNLQIFTDFGSGYNFDFVIDASAGGLATSGTLVASGSPLSGKFYAQDSTAFNFSSISGSYTYRLSGSSNEPPVMPFGIAGILTADGNGSITGLEDSDLGGVLGSNVPITGTYTAPDSNGRGSFALNYGTEQDTYAYYVVSSNFLLIVQSEVTGNPPFGSGIATRQTGSNFTNAFLQGATVFFSQASDFAGSTTDVQAGSFSFDGNGNFTVAADENNAGAVTSVADSGAYSVDASGRVTLSGSTRQWVAYLQDLNSGFIVGTDANATTGGFVPQQGGSYSNASLTGAYVLNTYPGIDLHSVEQSGLLSSDGLGNLSGTLDFNNSTTFTGGETFASTYALDSSGRGALAASSVTDAFVFYMDSPGHAFAISTNPGTTNSLVQEWTAVTSTPHPDLLPGGKGTPLATSCVPAAGTSCFARDTH